jgi:hypothetical protein
MLAWAITNPPFAAPDEPDHYLRAIGLAGGQLLGKPVQLPVPPNASPEEMRLFTIRDDGAHLVRVPAGLWAAGLTCNAFASDMPADCLNDVVPAPRETEQMTLMSGYEPLDYLVPGLVARLGNDPFSADRLGRVGSAFVCLCFLVLAILLLWARDPGGLSLIGLVAAITPMTIFTAAVINPSGAEIMSSVGFLAALIRVARDKRPATWVWAGLAVSGASLALSRSPGPAWVMFDCAAVATVVGFRRAGLIVREKSHRGALLATATIILGAMATSMTWQAVYGPPSAGGLGEILRKIPHAMDFLGQLLTGEVGIFGWLDSPMPAWSVLAWESLVVAILTIGLVLGNRRIRWGLLATTAGMLALSVGYAASYRVITGTGDAQGRHLLPIAVSIPLLAGEVILWNAGTLRKLEAGHLLLPVGALAAFLQMVAWYWNALRHAQGVNGSRNLLESPAWSPPLGWALWVIVVAASCLLLTAAAVRPGYPRRADGERAPEATVTRRVR